MTSPNINKPESTNEKYDDVYSRGSSFGQDLSESSVRSLLTGRVKSPLSQFLQWGANLIGGAVNDIANILTGTGGASYEVLTGAAVERLGDIRTQITEAAKDFQNLADKAEELGTKQDGILEDVAKQNVVIEQAKEAADKGINDAKNLITQVKAIADANKAKVGDAIAKADKANADLATLSPKVTDAVAKASKATSDVSTLTPKVTAAQNRADSAYTEAGKVRNEVTPKIEAAQSKGQEALSVADKAVSWLKNPSEIGTSVIAIDPETKRPYYANNLEVVEDNAPNSVEPVYMRPETSTGLTTHGPKVLVDPKIKYTVSFWAKADRPGSIIYGQMRGTNGSTMAPDGGPLFRGTITETNPPQPSNKGEDGKYVHSSAGNSYFISRLELPTEWTYYENEIQFSEGVTSVSIATMYWNHQYGVKANQYISGLDIRPQIPTQASVDEAQNDAIKANQEILRQQDEINEAQRVANLAQKNFNDNQTKWNQAVDRSLTTQKTVNDNFKKWTDGATEAIEANKNAIKALNAPQMGTSVIPLMPGTKTPAWTVNADWSSTNATAIKDGDPTWYKFDGTRVPGSYNMVAVDSSLEYDFSVWVHGTTGSKLFVELRDQDGQHAVKSGSITGYGKNDNQGSRYLIENMTLTSGWRKVSTRITLNPGVKFIYVDRIYGNHPNGVEGSAYLADMRMIPHVPSQADVNKALFDSDKALLDLTKEIDERSKLNSRFDKEQRRTNKVVQAQLWNHQDMIEQLDIRAPKTAGRKPKEGVSESVPYKNSKGYYTNGYRTDHPYFNIWVTNTGAIVAMRGSWVGQYEININWTNGAIDRWTVDVTGTQRVFEFRGGASHIDIRYVTSTVFPRSLCREARIIRDKIEDPEGLIRSVEYGNIRLKNSATCNKDVRYENFDGSMGWIKAGTVIPSGTELSTDGNSCVFKEVDDPGKGEYSVNSSMPPSGTTSIGYTT